MKLSLRVDLSSFINTDIEEKVLNKLESIHKDDIKYYLTLWYREGSLTSEDINKFLLKYDNQYLDGFNALKDAKKLISK